MVGHDNCAYASKNTRFNMAGLSPSYGRFINSAYSPWSRYLLPNSFQCCCFYYQCPLANNDRSRIAHAPDNRYFMRSFSSFMHYPGKRAWIATILWVVILNRVNIWWTGLTIEFTLYESKWNHLTSRWAYCSSCRDRAVEEEAPMLPRVYSRPS